MSAVAGRVLLIPKGSYNSGITYNMLDVVTYEYDSYVAKTTTIGHDPTDTTYWQKMTDVGDDVNSLKETFTNNGAHNLLPMTLADIKRINTGGIWSGNVYNYGGLNYTIETDSNGNVTQIVANGTPSNYVAFLWLAPLRYYDKAIIANGAPANGSYDTFGLQVVKDSLDYSYLGIYDNNDYAIGVGNYSMRIRIAIGYTANNIVFKPMFRLASDPDSAFEPYAMTNKELTQAKLDVVQLKTVVAASSDFADFKTRIAAL